jgi:hypothetical protein
MEEEKDELKDANKDKIEEEAVPKKEWG